jgi:2-aminoethylphosphonate-pyruvate transaminase
VILLNPGPVNVSARVRAALALPDDICHREREYSDLQESIRARLGLAFAPAGDFTPVLITGSGTAAVEAAVTSAISECGSLVIVSNGVYGRRMVIMAEAAHSPHAVVEGPWTSPPDMDDLTRKIANPDVEAVAVVHHETTTGLLNPVADIGRLARAHRKLLIVDAVSSLGGDALDPDEIGADLVVGTSGKCIQAFPGIGFVLVRTGLVPKLATNPRRSVYLALWAHLEAQQRRSVPFTPAVQIAYALDEALAELLEEGVAARVARYADAARVIREGSERLGLVAVLPPELRSNSLTSFWLPAGRTYEGLHDGLKARKFVIYEGQGRLSREFFRVANMGALVRADFARFVEALGAVLQ